MQRNVSCRRQKKEKEEEEKDEEAENRRLQLYQANKSYYSELRAPGCPLAWLASSQLSVTGHLRATSETGEGYRWRSVSLSSANVPE